jgi:hypothetical protein
MGNLKIVESNKQIEKMIKSALVGDVDKVLSKAVSRVKSAIGPIITSALASSPEISSLSSGQLRAEFGLTSDPSQAIISSVVNSINVTVSRVDKNLNGGFSIEIQPDSFSNLLSGSFSEQLIDGGTLPWLEWLLTAGDSILIADFGVEFGNYGRTGKARMSKKKAPYKVPSVFSGTIDNNFVTRAIDGAFPQIKEIIRRSL